MKQPFDLSKIDMNLLTVFNILLKEQSLTGTARKPGLTTPTISASVKRLQLLLDDPVVVRKGRGATPTR